MMLNHHKIIFLLVSSCLVLITADEIHHHAISEASTGDQSTKITITTVVPPTISTGSGNNSTAATLVGPQPGGDTNATTHDNSDAGKIIPINTSGLVTTTPIPTEIKTKLIDGIKTIIDLSYPLDQNTLYWPTHSGFVMNNIVDGVVQNHPNETGYYIKAENFSSSIHCGTHLDAPKHFSKDGWSVDKIPLERLIDVRIHVIDLSEKVKVNPSYNFIREDFVDGKTNQSLVTANSVVLVYTGRSKSYSLGQKEYFGTDTKNMSLMHIPGFSKEAAQFMVDMSVYGVGFDAPSADSSDRHGADNTLNPIAHVILNSNNIYILENINDKLSELVGQDATVRLTAAPLPIVGASGSPVRLVAVTAHDDYNHFLPKSSATRIGFTFNVELMTALIYAIVAIILFQD